MLAAILAGGEGARIGGGKPARLLAGQSLLDRAIARACSWGLEPVIVTRVERPHSDYRVIVDRKGVPGPLGALVAAADDALTIGEQRLLLLACDMPFLPGDLREKLDARLVDPIGCVMANSGGRDHPVCSLWRTDALANGLPAYLKGGDRSLIGLAKKLGYVTVSWPLVNGDPFTNINTPADLAEAEARLS